MKEREDKIRTRVSQALTLKALPSKLMREGVSI